VIVYDYLCNPSMLEWARDDAEIIFAGKRSGHPCLTQEQTNELLVRRVAEGRRVARVKGGDPFVFGRGGEEAEALRRAGLAFDLTPGVSSSVAAPSYAGIPVTHRGVSAGFMVVTGHRGVSESEPLDYASMAGFRGTVVILMGVGRLPVIAEQLQVHGMRPDHPAAVIQWGTLGRQRTLTATLEELPRRVREEGVTAPSIIVLGPVVTLREQLAWFEDRPWVGRSVVVALPRGTGWQVEMALAELGADARSVAWLREDVWAAEGPGAPGARGLPCQIDLLLVGGAKAADRWTSVSAHVPEPKMIVADDQAAAVLEGRTRSIIRRSAAEQVETWISEAKEALAPI
jgi:uroporphyrinogen III methyltransferase/synthase